MFEHVNTPHCPAGHLSHKGREQIKYRPSQTFEILAKTSKLLFSPLVGEMSGRTVRGAAPTSKIAPHHA
jgi:hypothetical protein